jgi:hypothetical protein
MKNKKRNKENCSMLQWVFDEAEIFIFKVNVFTSSVVYCLVAGMFFFYGMRFFVHMVGLMPR